MHDEKACKHQEDGSAEYPVCVYRATGDKARTSRKACSGFDFSSKAIHFIDGMTMAFQNIVPSFHPVDLCVGIAAAAIIRLVVMSKAKRKEVS